MVVVVVTVTVMEERGEDMVMVTDIDTGRTSEI